MKYYFNITIIILSMLTTNMVSAEDIVLPVISDEIRELASQSAKDRSNARISAYQFSEPVATEKLKQDIKKMVDQNKLKQLEQKQSIKQLLDKTINNKIWKTKQARYIKNLNKDLGMDDKSADQNKQVSGHRLYLFVSSSIPKAKMRQYAKDLVKYPNAQMIMRGFIGGAKKMQPTMAYIKSIIAKDESCTSISCKNYNTKINIDPVLFNRYGIHKVPTLVYVDELSGASYCSEGNTDIVNAQGVHRFTGLAPLKYMIRELAEATKLSKLEQLYQNNYESNNQ